MEKAWSLIWIFSAVTGAAIAQPPRVDLVFAVDRSSSVGNTYLELSLHVIRKLLDHFSISSSTTRVSFMTYASKVNTEFKFTSHHNRECLYLTLKKVKIRSVNETAHTDLALKSATALFRKYSIPHTKKILILFTNGRADKLSSLSRPIKQTKASSGIEIFVIGMGNGPSNNTLKYVASLLYLRNSSQIPDIISSLQERAVLYTQCSGEGKIRDECNRECECINGTLTNCYRVRKEFTTLTPKEKQHYLQAYKNLTTKEPFKSKYLKFIHIHYIYFRKGIHKFNQFLPWHRWYIWQFENLLRQIDCSVTVSFWDWSFWANVAWDEGKHIWKDGFSGLGSNGNPKRDFCVKSGLFREGRWVPPFFENSSEIVRGSLDTESTGEVPKTYVKHDKHPLCLRRKFNRFPYRLERVKRALELNASEFKDFELEVRGHYHDDLHNQIGGTMCTDFAADSPEFFFHHGFLDNIWYRWQQKSKDRLEVFFKKNKQKLLACPYIADQFVDSHKLPKCTIVKYEEFIKGKTPPKLSENMKKYIKKRKNNTPQKNNSDEEEEEREDDDITQQDDDDIMQREDEIEERHEVYDEEGAKETDNININKDEDNDNGDKSDEQNERNSLDSSSTETTENIRRLFTVDEDEIKRLKYLDERLGDHRHRCT